MQIRIYYEDTDAGGIVYHANYIKYCERARSEWLLDKGVVFYGKRHFVVSSLECKFHKPSFFGDILEVSIEVMQVKNASVKLHQKIKKISDAKGNKFDELIFSADVVVAFVENLKPTKMDKELIDIFSS